MCYLGCLLFCVGSSQQLLVLSDVLIQPSDLLLNMSRLPFLVLYFPLQVSERKNMELRYLQTLLSTSSQQKYPLTHLIPSSTSLER